VHPQVPESQTIMEMKAGMHNEIPATIIFRLHMYLIENSLTHIYDPMKWEHIWCMRHLGASMHTLNLVLSSLIGQ
jgi:hypothetical protein